MANFFIIVIFLNSLLAISTAKCPPYWDSPRKNIVCYYSGKQVPSSLDACLCTHLVYSNIGINQNKNVVLSKDVVDDFETFLSQNPTLKVIASIGGESLDAKTFSSLITEREALGNFTSSINSLYSNGIIHGVEIDWEWPIKKGGKKDRMKLIRYARQIKIAVGEEVPTRRPRRNDIHKRSSEDETTAMAWLDEGSRRDEGADEVTKSPRPSPAKNNPNFQTKYFPEPSSNKNSEPKARQFLIPSIPASGELDLIDLNEDVKSLDLGKKPEGFILFLRLPSSPEYLVQGYDFGLLNKFVDYYILSTNNMTGIQNATFHHSRLMGVADVENADSILDVIANLGADERKLILTATSFGNKFSLLDAKRTLPGAAASDRIDKITYQMVCETLKHGNWTIEREEDLTAPYGFNDKIWMAFDDSMSLLVKTKYALLRNLGGVALDSIEADDVDNVCGHGEQSLLKTIRKTLTHLERRTRQSIIHSLEEDLIASPRALTPVVASGVKISPFRIIRIVDREGQIKALRHNSETSLECSRQGYYRNPEDCSLFYRCVKFNQYEDDYTIFEYGCPVGLVFDERWEVCVWPSQAAPCDGSTEIRPVPRNPYICGAEGYFVDPENCRWFFACFDHKGDGNLTLYEFRCPFGLGFDEKNLICNWPWLVTECGGTPSAAAGKLSRPNLNREISGQPTRQEKAFNNQRPALNVNRINDGGDPSLNSFKSQNPERQSTLSNGRPDPTFAPTTKGLSTFEDIVSDDCDNCESQSIEIGGSLSTGDDGSLQIPSPLLSKNPSAPVSQLIFPEVLVTPVSNFSSISDGAEFPQIPIASEFEGRPDSTTSRTPLKMSVLNQRVPSDHTNTNRGSGNAFPNSARSNPLGSGSGPIGNIDGVNREFGSDASQVANSGNGSPSGNQDLKVQKGNRFGGSNPNAGRQNELDGNTAQPGRGGREFNQSWGTISSNPNSLTAITRPFHKQPPLIAKFKGTDWNKFGPGGFRNFDDTIGAEVCERPGLFRHPTDCDKFYECYYDKWINKFTVHVFPCPIALGYDTGISACSWPMDGPQCQQNL